MQHGAAQQEGREASFFDLSSRECKNLPWNIPGLLQPQDSIVPCNSRSLNSCRLRKRSNTFKGSHAVPSDTEKKMDITLDWNSCFQIPTKIIYLDVKRLLNIEQQSFMKLNSFLIQFTFPSLDFFFVSFGLHKISTLVFITRFLFMFF